MTTTTKTKTCHSDEVKEYFLGWLTNWDTNIQTLDDVDGQTLLKNKLNNAIRVITSIQNESDQKVFKKAKGEKEAGELLKANQEKQWYREMTKVHKDLQAVMFSIDQLYELKNRKLYDNIRLRAEIANLKSK
ncbi:hypothetical protein NBY09_01745 [Elizabethkingia anophelis]|uniref:hypothetical protein n=1 Tax=Elizabethkingia TaxID=308865 RepID=UPI000B35E0C0|nr:MULTISPECIES: hypothetical protein [Elizabethkingia]MDC8024903.1 hypothetical protein [Elizabethkingia anophelis]